MEIIEPNENPVTDNNFTFDSASPGVCTVTGTGDSGVHSENANLEWTLDNITGSAKTSTPDPPKGANITFKYTTLPSLNEQFGNKTLKLKYPATGCADTQNVQVFYLRDEKNHPGGTTPNWYYYWTQITGSGDIVYGDAHATRLGYYDYDGSDGHLDNCIIYDRVVATDNPTGPKGKAGIDCFGQTVTHERKHRAQFYAGFTDTTGDGIPDYDATKDQDRDWLSDSYEDANGFDKTKQDTDGDGILDLEEEPIVAESNWPNDSQNDKDWSDPGKNSTK